MNAKDDNEIHSLTHLSQRRNPMNHLMTFINDEDGATAMEYGLLAALISAVIIASVTTLGNVIGTTLNTISGSMKAAS